jgi:hypothetical protein
VIESVSSKLAITIIKQRVVVSFIKGTSTPTGLIIPVINNDLFLSVIRNDTQIKLVKSLHLDEVVRRTLIGVIAPEMSNFAVFGHYLENYNR